MAKPRPPKPWRATVHLDRLDAASGQWRITTGSAHDPLARDVATDPEVRAAVDAWITAHRAKQKPEAEESTRLTDSIRRCVTTAYQAMPPAPPKPKVPAVVAAAPRRSTK